MTSAHLISHNAAAGKLRGIVRAVAGIGWHLSSGDGMRASAAPK